MKPEQLEIERLRREVAKQKAERDILKRPQPTLAGTRYEVRVHCKAPFDLAGGMVLRSAGSFSFRIPCLVSIALRANTPAMMRSCRTRSRRHDGTPRHRCVDHGDLASRKTRCSPASLHQGSQHMSEQFQRLMGDHGIPWSMSLSGNVWDNAEMESFQPAAGQNLNHHGAPRAEARHCGRALNFSGDARASL